MATSDEDIPRSKELNNDWKAESTWGADGLEISLLSEGNEAKGEVPHANAQMNIPQYLQSEECDLEPGEASPSPEEISTTMWATEGVTMTLTLTGESELIDVHEGPIASKVEEVLPDDWEKKE